MPRWNIRSFLKLSLIQQFRMASLIILIFGLVGVSAWIIQQIESGVVRSTSITTSLYVESFFDPSLQELSQTPGLSPATVARLDGLLLGTPLGGQIVALKVWSPQGGVLYDTNHTDIGKTFPIEDRLAVSLNGEVTTRISSLDSEENAGERQFGQLIETYSPIHSADGSKTVAAIEFYQKMDDLQGIIDNAQRGSWLIVAGVGLIMYLLLTLFVQRASNTITSQQTALKSQVAQLTELLEQNKMLNERVRNAARSVTTLNERLFRRVGSEIHDGPAQELSLALLKLDGIMARNETTCRVFALNHKNEALQAACSVNLDEVQTTLQQALQEIRGIASGMSLPHLSELSLAETITRPVRAHERKTGTQVDLHLDHIPDHAPLPIKITLYRLIQEALNNAYRHGGGAGQTVQVHSEGSDLKIEVDDRGPGFDVERWQTSEDHLGLSGMRERVESLGGQFNIESQAGSGTKIRAILSLQAEGIGE